MGKVSTNISLEEGLKKSSQELFADLGMDFTTAITIFLKQCIRVQGLPFEVVRDVPNPEIAVTYHEKTSTTKKRALSDVVKEDPPVDTESVVSSKATISVIIDDTKKEEYSRSVNDASAGVQD